MINRIKRFFNYIDLPGQLNLIAILALLVCLAFPESAFNKLTKAFFILALPICCLIFGAMRIRSRHPFFNHGYWDWLKTTPWKYPQPLPLGNVTLDIKSTVGIFHVKLGHRSARIYNRIDSFVRKQK